jgi:hypothetical protein
MPRRKRSDTVLEEIERRIDNSPSLLTDEDKQEARDRAREHVSKARKTSELDAYFKAQVREEERSYEPKDQLEDFTVDLPEYAPMIVINNIGYYHGCTYEVPHHMRISLMDIQARAWEHENEIHGRRRKGDVARDPFNRGINMQRDVRFSMSTGAVTGMRR